MEVMEFYESDECLRSIFALFDRGEKVTSRPSLGVSVTAHPWTGTVENCRVV